MGAVLLEREPAAADVAAAEPQPVTRTDARKAARLIRRLDRKADPDRYAAEGPVPEAAFRRAYHQLVELWRQQGHDESDPDVRAAALRGIAPMAGGATGRGGMAFAHNLPAPGSYLMNPAEFAKWTERNDMPLEQRSLTGLGAAPIQQRISNVGVMSGLQLVFKGSLVVSGGGTVTATYQWPYNIIKRYQLNVNGSTGIIACEGLDLRVRHQRIFRNPRDAITTAPATTAQSTTAVDPNPGVIANGTYAIVVVYDIPVPHDDFTLVGSIFAQSDQTYLSQQITPAASAELFSLAGGSTATLTGTFSTQMTFYDVPTVPVQGQGFKVLLPDLRWLHGYFDTNLPFANTGEVTVPMVRAAGQLLTYAFYIDNGGAAQIAIAALTSLRFQYGGNRRPREYTPPEQLLWENQHNYNGLLQPNYAMLDFEADSPERDLVYPKGVTEIGVVPTIATGTTINANAHVHSIEETLFAGV